MSQSLYAERTKRIDDAVALKEPDRVPIAPSLCTLPFYLAEGTSYRDYFYDHDKAAKAVVDFYEEFKPDAVTLGGFASGKANEIAGSTMIEWPGKPGTKVEDNSTHQVLEFEYMHQDEYEEMLHDFTGFMLRKYIPRAFPGLKGLSTIGFAPTIILNTGALSPLFQPETLEAYEKLAEIAKLEAETAKKGAQMRATLAEKGFPALSVASGEAPYDILSDYFRGTVGTFDDLIDCEDLMERACDMFADLEIAKFSYLRDLDVPNKRVTFPLHKGMDGFMRPEQYEKLYWRPLRRVIDALIDMGVTPFLYGEGPYNSRLEQMTDIPVGKTIIHFERVDMAKAKKLLGDKACLSGNLSIQLLERGTKEQVIDETKRLLDLCAPGGGYIFDTDAGISEAKRENVEALFETLHTYGKY